MKERSGRKLSLPIIVFLAFLMLKLANIIDWEWLWVCAPLWLPVGVGAALFIIYIIVTVALSMIEKKEGIKNEQSTEIVNNYDDGDVSLRQLR